MFVFVFLETVEQMQCDMRCDMNAMSDTERSGNNKLGKRKWPLVSHPVTE